MKHFRTPRGGSSMINDVKNVRINSVSYLTGSNLSRLQGHAVNPVRQIIVVPVHVKSVCLFPFS
jgi:hypothetical protein